MDKPKWEWAVAVITAPRPTSTLERTILSLSAAGFADPLVVRDTTRAGSWPTWLAALRRLNVERPNATVYLTVEDDAVFCRDLRIYLEQTLWPSKSTVLCSPYCPAVHRSETTGWHRENRGWHLVGSLCWAIPSDMTRKIIVELSDVVSFNRVDAIVGRWAQAAGYDCWYHTPSLVQHIGLQNSALGDNAVNEYRQAGDFVGEERSASLTSHTTWTIGPTLANRLVRLLRPGMRTLECGSGLSTHCFIKADCDHLALEHDERFAAPLPQVHYCPLIGKPPWYDWRPQTPFDLVLIDGPPTACGGRSGILSHIRALAHPRTIFVCNDTNRPDDAQLADTIAGQLGLAQVIVAPTQPMDFGRQSRILVPSDMV